jgi:hypothetical protein
MNTRYISPSATFKETDVDDNQNGLPVNQGGSFNNITSATTTQVKTGTGYLHAVVVNTTAAGTIKIIDDVQGTTANIGTLKVSVAEGTYVYNVKFTLGLRIVTGAASDITVVYR